jgi:4-amino-4-deoxy-L-arabinose transferase-like glycosyltransferase
MTAIANEAAGRRWILQCLFLGLVALAVLGTGLGWRDPWPPDEPRYALVAKELVDQGGDWLFPRRNGELYAEKPPLFIWAVAAGYASGLPLRVAFLLPSLLAALGTLTLVVVTARKLWNRRAALAAGWALLITLQFTVQGRWAQMDALLGLWTTTAVMGLVIHLLRGPAWGWTAVAGIAMALGVLTKGLGLLPALLLLPWWWMRRRGTIAPLESPGGWRWMLMPALTLVTLMAWLLPLAIGSVHDADLAGYRDRLLGTQTVGRYFNPWHHHRPAWYYLEQIPVLWLPLSLLLPWLIPAWWRRLRRGDPATTLLLGWVALIVVFFSFSPGKRGVYLYPALPALVLAAAPLLTALTRRRDVQISALVFTMLLGCSVAGALGPMQGFVPERLTTALADQGVDLADLASGALAITVVIAIALGAGRLRLAVHGSVAAIAGGWALSGLLVLPYLNEARYPATFMNGAQRQAGLATTLGMVSFREQFVLAAPEGLTTFGYNRPPLEEAAEAARWLIAEPDRALLVPSDRIDELGLDPNRLEALGTSHRQDWFLARPAAVVRLPEKPQPVADNPRRATPVPLGLVSPTALAGDG